MVLPSNMYGLKKDETIKERIEKVNGDKAVRYRVVSEVIDFNILRSRREALVAMLEAIEPSDEELIELGRTYHNYYSRPENASIEAEIASIDAILSL